MESTCSRGFSLKDIRAFAAMSGDPNPVHIDPEFAARTPAGAVVAHGMHLVLWALDTLPADDTSALPGGVQTVFLSPVIVGDEVQAEVAQPGLVRLRVRDKTVAKVKFVAARVPDRWTGSGPAHSPTHPPRLPEPPESLPGVSGALRLPDGENELLVAFPNLGKRVGPRVLQGLAGIATVSGAVLGGLTTEFSAGFSNDEPGDDLEYKVMSYHPALRRFEMAFRGYGLVGKVAAMVSGGGAH